MTRVLVDTSVWVAHFRVANPKLQSLLAQDQVLTHPLVILEIACGTPPAPRERTLSDLQKLSPAVVATEGEVLSMVSRFSLHESGCGAVEMSLLASVLITPEAKIWTLDKHLSELAHRLDVTMQA